MNKPFITHEGNSHFFLRIISTFLLLLCISTHSIKAQNHYLDSLYAILPTLEEDTNKVILLNKISFACTKFDTNKAIQHANTMLQLSEKLNYKYGIGLANNKLEIGYALLGEMELSNQHNKAVQRIGEEIGDQQLISWAIGNRALNYSMDGKYEKAIKLYQQTYDIAVSIRDTTQQIVILGNLIYENRQIDNLEQVKFYQQKLFDFKYKIKDSNSLSSIYREQAEFHRIENQPDSIILYLKKARDEVTKINDKYFIAYLSTEIANEYYDLGQKSIAYENIDNGIRILKTLPFDQSSPELNLNVSKFFYSTNDLSKSENYALIALDFAKQVSSQYTESHCYKMLADIYKSRGLFKQSLSYAERHHFIQDSLLTVNKIVRINEIEEKYLLEKKEQENELLLAKQIKQENTIKNQRIINISLGVIAVLSFFVGLLSYRLYYIKNANNKSLAQNIKDRTNELSISNQKLKNSNLELERFAYIASHDLKEPLRNISNSITFLDKTLKGNLDTDQSDLMKFVKKNTKLMYQLIEDILEYSKLSDNKMAIENVDINDVVDSIIYSTKNAYKEKSPQIIINNSFPTIRSHRIRMHLLFKNIIENGIKYNDNENPCVKINYKEEDAFHHFSISDNGIGIDKNQHENIFEMFKRLHNKYTYEGTGLGLSLSKKIISNHGGKIWVESEIGKGSTFYFTISKTVIPFTDTIS